MTLSDLFLGLITTALAGIGGSLIGYRIASALKTVAPAASEPRVVVNVPPGFKPMTGLPPTEIEGARAVLFWTVYSKAIDAFTSEGMYTLDREDEAEAYNSANRAVETVFGPVKP